MWIELACAVVFAAAVAGIVLIGIYGGPQWPPDL